MPTRTAQDKLRVRSSQRKDNSPNHPPRRLNQSNNTHRSRSSFATELHQRLPDDNRQPRDNVTTAHDHTIFCANLSLDETSLAATQAAPSLRTPPWTDADRKVLAGAPLDTTNDLAARMPVRRMAVACIVRHGWHALYHDNETARKRISRCHTSSSNCAVQTDRVSRSRKPSTQKDLLQTVRTR